MKKAFKFVATLCIAGFIFTSCTEEDSNIADPVLEAAENNMEAGTWRITLFEDSGKDETGHFSGYDFTFSEDGTLTASNGTTTVEGTWSISHSNSTDDSPDDLDFNIFFNMSNNFEDLNDDWDIVANTDMKIELIDVSGGNGGTDLLTFEKN